MWNCQERQKGVKGNGCKCRNVKEEGLIVEICNELRWPVDEDRMAEEVQRVDVYANQVEVTVAAEKTT